MSETLADRLRQPTPLILDGAMGTELDRRGVVFENGAWSGSAVVTHPDVVRQIHSDYADAGAELHIANSFATSRHVLALAGLENRFDEINDLAVSLCREGIRKANAPQAQWIAGSVSTYAKSSSRAALPPPDELRRNLRDQCRVLGKAGVDALALEMLMDIDVSVMLVEAAAETGLPFWAGFTCLKDDDGQVFAGAGGYRGGDPVMLDAALDAVIAAGDGAPMMLSIMHSQPDVTDAALGVVRRRWSGDVAVYPNSGRYVNPSWDFASVCTPADFVIAARRWAADGVRIIGGCCGIGPEHIRALAEGI